LNVLESLKISERAKTSKIGAEHRNYL